ncbi:MAG: FecR domain-containing protein [Candidatus Didemnitutus sp.]|nr:FecR domain-containing protein [Candidatus Didemnitutus sp.]
MKRSSQIDSAAAGWILKRDAGLTASEQAEFANWQLEPAHAEALARKEKAWSTLDRPLSAGQADEVLSRLAARAQQRRRRRLGTSLVLALCLCFVGFWWQQQSSHIPEPRSVVLLPETRTLEDGTIVYLKAGAHIDVSYSADLRRVALTSGEVHFQVAKNPARPFIVTAGGVDFRAVGTAFAVQLGGSQVDLVVTEGRVAVERKLPETVATVAAPEPVVVAAGNQLSIELAKPEPFAPSAISDQELSTRLAWKAPRIEFSEMPLSEAVQQMNRYAKRKLIVVDPELAQMPVSGIFRADNTETLVDVLEDAGSVRVEREPDRIVLRRAR